MTAHDQHRENLVFYAVGALPAEEAELLKRHLGECRECREELRGLSDVAARIAMAVDFSAPPLRVREQLMARLQAEPFAASSEASKLNVVSVPWARRVWFWVPTFAASVLAMALGVLWNRDREIEIVNRQLMAKLEAAGLAIQQARELTNMLSASNAQHITLVATGEKPKPEAKTVYSLQQRSLVMLASNLKSLPAEKTYELWLLPLSGARPVPAGIFKPDAAGSATLVLAQFSRAVAAKGFAVTIEPALGSEVPTLPIVLSGSS